MKKLLALTLALLTLFALASCSGKGNGNNGESGTGTLWTDEGFDPNLPDVNYKGYVFTFAVRGTEDSSFDWDNDDIVQEVDDGDHLNSAKFKRNRYMREKYGVELAVKYCGNTNIHITGSDMFQYIDRAFFSGDGGFDAILSSPFDSTGYIMSNYVVDLQSIPYLNLQRKWWDQGALRDLKIGNKTYMATGDVTYIDNMATHVMVFNKDIAAELQLDDHYETVRNQEWVLEKFFENCSKATKDLNGDLRMNHDDRYGYSCWQDASFAHLASCGINFGTVNSEGVPELTFFNDHTVDVWEDLIDFWETGDAYSTWNNQNYFDDGKANLVMFCEGHALYSWATINSVLAYRAYDDFDFGIIPYPKYNEYQEDYITSPHTYGHTMLTVPSFNDNLERTGIILEAFSAKSAELVTPAFYEKTLKGKATKDIESEEMLDIIFARNAYDIGYFFMWGELPTWVMEAWNDEEDNIQRVYDEYRQAAMDDALAIAEKFK